MNKSGGGAKAVANGLTFKKSNKLCVLLESKGYKISNKTRDVEFKGSII